jgi:hypothetical protein
MCFRALGSYPWVTQGRPEAAPGCHPGVFPADHAKGNPRVDAALANAKSAGCKPWPTTHAAAKTGNTSTHTGMPPRKDALVRELVAALRDTLGYVPY